MSLWRGARSWGVFVFGLAVVGGLFAVTPAAAQTAIQVGTSVNGSLTQSDDLLGSDRFVDLYEFQGRAGQRVTITVTSSAFGAVAAVGDGGSFFQASDPSVPGGNATVSVTLPNSGRFLVTVSSAELRRTGGYTIAITDGDRRAATPPDLSGLARAAPAPAPAPAPSQGLPPPSFDNQQSTAGVQPSVRIGATISGSLGRNDDTLETGSFIDAYRLQGRAGQRVRLTVQGSGFDEVVAIGTVEGDFFEMHDTSEDPSGNADLVVMLPRDGEYIVAVNARFPGQSGAYTLWVSDGR